MKEAFEKIVERLEEIKEEGSDCGGCPYVKADFYACINGFCEKRIIDQAIEIVNQVSEEYGNDGWIPCEREKPPQPKEIPIFENKPLELYLVSEINADYPRRAFWDGKVFTDGWGRLNVIAWQPLPAPYKPEEEKQTAKNGKKTL